MGKPTEANEPRAINISGGRMRDAKFYYDFDFDGTLPFALFSKTFEHSERFPSMLLIGARARLVPIDDTSAFKEVLVTFKQNRHSWWIGKLPNGSIGIQRNMEGGGILFPVLKGLPHVNLRDSCVWW